VIFLLSEKTEEVSTIGDDIIKVLRQKNIVIIPAVIDDVGAASIPVYLKFIRPLDFRENYDSALNNLIKGLHHLVKSSNELFEGNHEIFVKPVYAIFKHFRRYMTLPPLTFCWQITVENLVVSLTTTGLVLFFFQPNLRTNLENLSVIQFFWLVIIIGPLFETIVLQMMPVLIAKHIGFNYFGQIVFSMVPFAALHFSRSFGTGIGAGIIGGFYSAFTYVHWHQKSLWTAFWVTALSHALFNFGIFAMMIGEF
jgi:hypothetical protein